MPEKSQNMLPIASRTAAGSRITVYFPAGSITGRSESRVFCGATSAKRCGSRFAMSGELAFWHAEESPPSMVMETSANVCVYQLLKPRELKIPSEDSELENIPAVVN